MSNGWVWSNKTSMPFMLLAALVFYVGWHSVGMHAVVTQGQLRGPDDFLRLHQILNWLGGQSWFDLTAYRMAPPDGADIHWSRLVDLPIGALIVFFEVFFDPELAWRLAVIIWPAMLYLATFWLLIKLCEELIGEANAFLLLLFFALNAVTLAETAPGRIDHHNVQILLLVITLLGLTKKPGWPSDMMIGIAIPVSLSIGMDSAALFLPLLVFIGLRWVFQPEFHTLQLVRIGAILGSSSILIFGATFAFENWSDARCDAYSRFYVSALFNLGIAFILIGCSMIVSNMVMKSAVLRFVVCGICGVAALGFLLWIYPQCASGPFGNFTPELYDRWLSRVVEAKPILEAVQIEPHRWFSNFSFALVMLGVSVAMCWRHARHNPELLVLFAIVVICTLGIFFQIRFLRTGIIVAIPFCLLFANLCWQWLKTLPFSLEAARVAALGLICLMMTSLVWSTVGKVVFAEASTPKLREAGAGSPAAGKGSVTRYRCEAKAAYQALSALPKGIVMSNINSATPILVHTEHTVISGPYHRNGAAILSVMDFFETDASTARAVAQRLGVNYVSLCNSRGKQTGAETGKGMKSRIRSDRLPDWLEWVSDKDAGVLVLRMTN